MKKLVLHTAMLALCAGAAISAGAQTTSPGSTTPGVMPSTPQGTVTTPGTANGTTGTTSPYGTTTGTPYGATTTGRMSDADIRAYMDARNACASQPADQQQMCNDAANRRYSAVSPKCQQLTGMALGDCLRGTNH